MKLGIDDDFDYNPGKGGWMAFGGLLFAIMQKSDDYDTFVQNTKFLLTQLTLAVSRSECCYDVRIGTKEDYVRKPSEE